MAKSIALRGLSMLAMAGLVWAEGGMNHTSGAGDDAFAKIGFFDIEVLSDSNCSGNVSGVYRFKGVAGDGVPFFLRDNTSTGKEMFGNETVLFYRQCEDSPTESGWFFGDRRKWEMSPMGFCGNASSSLHLPMPNASNLSTAGSREMWHSHACSVGAGVSIYPLREEEDGLIIFGFRCNHFLNGLWTLLPESRMSGRPMYYQESEDGALVLQYRDDLPEWCEHNHRYSISSWASLEDGGDDCDAYAWSDNQYEMQPSGAWWTEECDEDGQAWEHIEVHSRTRTPWSSACSESLAHFIGDELCFIWDTAPNCPYHCHRMLSAAEQVCTDEDLMWSWDHGMNDTRQLDHDDNDRDDANPILEHLHGMWMVCEPSDYCYSQLSDVLSEQWRYCLDEICMAEETHDAHGSQCMDKYHYTLYACQDTDANMEIGGSYEKLSHILEHKLWCQEEEHTGGHCVMIPMELAQRTNAVHCMDAPGYDHDHDYNYA